MSALDLAQRLVPAGHGIHVLAYHLVGAGTTSPVDVPAADFRRQMEELARRTTTIPLDEAERRLRATGDPGSETTTVGAGPTGDGPAVVLTFDDAYRNFHTAAWPILRDLGLPATLYVPTGFVDSGAPVPMAAAGDLPAMSWDELATDREAGLTLGSHSHTHRELPALSAAEIGDDLGRARELLRRHTGSAAEHFCYPRALWDGRTEGAVADLHNTAAVAGGRLNRPGSGGRAGHLLRLDRVPVRRDLGPSVAPILDSAVWLREWLASRLRGQRAAWRRLAS